MIFWILGDRLKACRVWMRMGFPAISRYGFETFPLSRLPLPADATIASVFMRYRVLRFTE